MTDPKDDLRERIAEAQHEIWSHWMKYLFTKGYESYYGYYVILEEDTERWKRQMYTPYSHLSEREKDSDREQADKVIAAIKNRSMEEDEI